jgi:hypothetical protein
MLEKKVNISITNSGSILLIIIIAFALFMCYNSCSNSSGSNKNSNLAEISISQSSGTICSVISLRDFHKNWISNKDNFKLLTFDKAQYLENKKVHQKITFLENSRRNTINPFSSFLQNLLYSDERDELPSSG